MMGLSFLAPWFLLGASMLAIPWILHQIRRPEREPVPFSSLMFVPQIKKEVIERRRIQHILLMLLRMGILLLLALAFSRPVWDSLLALAGNEQAARHVILIDGSYSMGAEGRFDKAKNEARRIVDGLGAGEQIGVILFSQKPRVIAPLVEPGNVQAGSVEAAREAIEQAQLTEGPTDYLSALQEAQAMLLESDGEDQEAVRKVAHLITDFQKQGMPKEHAGWRLASQIEFKPIPVAETGIPDNFALTDLNIRSRKRDELRILGKVKNASAKNEEPRTVTLILNGQEAARQEVKVKPGNASQVAFTVAHPSHEAAEGRLELVDDALALDNRRYFAFSPSRKKKVLLLSGAGADQARTAAWFASRALPNEDASRWDIEIQTVSSPDALTRLEELRPEAVVLCDGGSLPPGMLVRLETYIRDGGSLLWMLNEAVIAEPAAQDLLAKLGIKTTEGATEPVKAKPFTLLSWVDFTHPVFLPFQGAQYNDFSTIYFFQYIPLQLGEDSASAAKPLARFEGEKEGLGAPAIVESRLGEGQAVVWSFSPMLQWNNLPRSSRFVPILMETLDYLDGEEEARTSRTVGEILAGPRSGVPDEQWMVWLPGHENEERLAALKQAGTDAWEHAGLAQWRREGGEEGMITESVNIDARESDLTPVDLQEFQWKLVAAPVTVQADENTPGKTEEEESFQRKRNEYGLPLVILLALGFIAEAWYASKLT